MICGSSSVFAVLFRKIGSDEIVTALGIDTATMSLAPIDECIGVDVYALDDIPLTSLTLLSLFRSLKLSFPRLSVCPGTC